MFSGQFYEKWVSVRESSMKLLLETVTCIITIETVMCIMQCRKYHLHNCNKDSHLCNYCRNCHPLIRLFTYYAAETSNYIISTKTVTCIIATETLTCIIATERSTNITVTESTTCIIAIECQLHSSNRNCHLQN